MLDLVDYFNMHNNIFLNLNKNHTTSLVEGNIIKYLCLKSVYIYLQCIDKWSSKTIFHLNNASVVCFNLIFIGVKSS